MQGPYIKFFIFVHCSSYDCKSSERYTPFVVPMDHFYAVIYLCHPYHGIGGNDHGTCFREQVLGLFPTSLVVKNHLLTGTLPRENKRT